MLNHNDIEIYFKPNGEIQGYITYKSGGKTITVTSDGTYTIGNNHAFTAKLDGEFNTGTEFKVELTGMINTYTGIGSGKYELEASGTTYKDDWTLLKIGNN